MCFFTRLKLEPATHQEMVGGWLATRKVQISEPYDHITSDTPVSRAAVTDVGSEMITSQETQESHKPPLHTPKVIP